MGERVRLPSSPLIKMGRRHANIRSFPYTKEFQSVLDLLSRKESCPSSAKMRKGTLLSMSKLCSTPSLSIFRFKRPCLGGRLQLVAKISPPISDFKERTNGRQKMSKPPADLRGLFTTILLLLLLRGGAHQKPQTQATTVPRRPSARGGGASPSCPALDLKDPAVLSA